MTYKNLSKKIKVDKYNFKISYHPEIEILCAKTIGKKLKSANNIVIKDDIILDLDKKNNLIGVEIFTPKKSFKIKKSDINLKINRIEKKSTIEIPEDYPLNDIPTIGCAINKAFSKCYFKISKSLKADHVIRCNSSSVVWELDRNDVLTGIYFLDIKQSDDCS